VSLFGNLEDLPLPYFLQMIAANRMTGKLVLTRRDGHGLLVFRAGKIIYAATNSVRETFGNILVLRRLVTVSTLTDALERQVRSPVEKRLGTILLEMGAIDRQALDDVMSEQVEKVLVELFRWPRGFVKFEAMEIPERGEVAVDASDLLMREGLPTDRVVMEVMSKLSQRDDDRLEREALALLRSGEEADGAASAGGVGGGGGGAPATLRSIMKEIRSPAFTGEVTLGILRFAGGLVRRGVLFLHSSGFITGMGQFGIEVGGESGDARVRRIKIPGEDPSVFHEVIEKQETYRGPLEERFWNMELVRMLGGVRPGEVMAVPMVVGDRVALIFYGDNAPDGAPLPAADDLEVLMIQGGLAIEKGVLERRLKDLEQREEEPLADALGKLLG
jgi:Domain of unknown function (DUF4388)